MSVSVTAGMLENAVPDEERPLTTMAAGRREQGADDVEVISENPACGE